MKPKREGRSAAVWGLSCVAALGGVSLLASTGQPGGGPHNDPVYLNADRMLDEGRKTFRFDTFGDEVFWGGKLRLHEAVATLSPTQALSLGLKVDSEALPTHLLNALKPGNPNLNNPAVTARLLKHNAVVGVKGVFAGNTLTSVGITCALCHSTVDNSVGAGVGKRRDGWANRDLNIGAIVAAAPDLTAFSQLLGVPVSTVREVLLSWGPGKFDAQLVLDGKAFQSVGGASAATLIPPAFGMAGVNEHTSTSGWGGVTYWNAFVANIEMHGQGTFIDPRLSDPAQFPVAAAAGFGEIRHTPDLVTPKLAALQFYQLAIPAPTAPAGSFNAAAAAAGKALFNGIAGCSQCHVPPLYTEPGYNTHAPDEIGIDPFQANRSPDRRYRTAPLKGLWTHTKGGFYHDGRFATLLDVVNHYNQTFTLNLSGQQKAQLVEFLKSL
jgi:hypothetical protein